MPNGRDFVASSLDLYHRSFDVYSDADAGGNHFYPSMRYNGSANMAVEGACREQPRTGSSCFKVTWNGRSGNDGWNWNGLLWQNSEDWRVPGPTYDLSGATKLTGWIRSATPGLRLKLLVGRPEDSCGEISDWHGPFGPEWQQFTISLTGKDLSRIAGGFGLVFNDRNSPDWRNGVTFWLDDIAFDLPRPKEPRLILSYGHSPARTDATDRNTAYVYDQALAIMLLASTGVDGDLERARLVADALLAAMDADRAYEDGRLRNAYMAGDLFVPGVEGARLPGWWDQAAERWFEDFQQVGSSAGNLAWVMLALITLHERTGEDRYLTAAKQLGDWVEGNCREESGGYTGGFEGGEPKPTRVGWKSTEHNLDLVVAFTRLYRLSKDATWRERARHALSFTESMFDRQEHRFLTGTAVDGLTPNRGPTPLNVNTWALLALGETNKTRQAFAWAEKNCRAKDEIEGFDFNDDGDGVWLEGTGQILVCYELLGRKKDAVRLLDGVRHLQAASGGYLAASRDGLTTGFTLSIPNEKGNVTQVPWLYYRQVHLGATCWMWFGATARNPYWDTPVSELPNLDDIR